MKSTIDILYIYCVSNYISTNSESGSLIETTLTKFIDINIVAQSLKEVSPNKIILTGNDPLMHDDLKSIIIEIKKLAPKAKIILNTNTIDLSKHSVNWLKASIDYFTIDIEGYRFYKQVLQDEELIKIVTANLNLINTHFGPFDVKIIDTSKVQDSEYTLFMLTFLSQFEICHISKIDLNFQGSCEATYFSSVIHNPQFNCELCLSQDKPVNQISVFPDGRHYKCNSDYHSKC